MLVCRSRMVGQEGVGKRMRGDCMLRGLTAGLLLWCTYTRLLDVVPLVTPAVVCLSCYARVLVSVSSVRFSAPHPRRSLFCFFNLELADASPAHRALPPKGRWDYARQHRRGDML